MTDQEKRKAAVDAVARQTIARVLTRWTASCGDAFWLHAGLTRADAAVVIRRVRQIGESLRPNPDAVEAAHEHLDEEAIAWLKEFTE